MSGKFKNITNCSRLHHVVKTTKDTDLVGSLENVLTVLLSKILNRLIKIHWQNAIDH